MYRQFKGWLGLFCLLLMPALAFSQTNVSARLKLYMGSREKQQVSTDVISSYQLKQLTAGSLFAENDVINEEQTLKRIYNLKDIHVLSILELAVNEEAVGSTQIIPLDESELLLGFGLVSRKENHFNLSVKEKRSSIFLLMSTDIIIPQQKSVVLGFEDSKGRIFFLSIYRDWDAPPDSKSGNLRKHIQLPMLLKKIKPDYPNFAIHNRIEGEVIIEAIINNNGDITQLQVKQSSHPLLERAATKAITQWKYRPYLIDSMTRPIKVVIKTLFSLKPPPE